MEFMDVDFNAVRWVLSQLATFDATAILKTWVNGWATTARFHDKRADFCIFGCIGCADGLSHYFKCSILWDALEQACGFSVGLDPLERLGLADLAVHDLLIVSAAFTTYHALKSEWRASLCLRSFAHLRGDMLRDHASAAVRLAFERSFPHR